MYKFAFSPVTFKPLSRSNRKKNHLGHSIQLMDIYESVSDLFQSKLLDMARDLLFNDNRAKLNDETLQKLAFLNGTAQQDHNAKLSGVPELNSTGKKMISLVVRAPHWYIWPSQVDDFTYCVIKFTKRFSF